MSRKVKFFRNVTNDHIAIQKLQDWLDECEADTENEYDIGDPIVYNGGLLVMYNVEPVPSG